MAEKKYWYQKQLRILQTVLREPDIINYDAVAVVKYMKKTYTNCIVVNAGGIVDFFDNETPMGRKNMFISGENMLDDLVGECHMNDIRVMVRVDFRGVEQERYEQKPDWFAQEADGSPKVGWGKIYKPCYNAAYSNDHAIDFIQRIMEKYEIDGVWENSVGFGDGPCYCKRCRDLFREVTGEEIPIGIPYASTEFEKYREWKAKCADEHLARMRTTVKSFGEEKAYCAEIFGMFHASNALNTGIDLYSAGKHFDFLVSPAFLDGSANPDRKWDNLIYAASSMRFLKSIDNTRQCVLLYGNNGTKWRYVKAPSVETKIWMWEAASVGAGFWNCMFNGQHPDQTFDRRNQGIETEVYKYLQENEERLDGLCPKAEVGILYSKNCRDVLGNDIEGKDQYGIYIKGAERALVENHISYNFIPDLNFTTDSLKKVKTLILPNTALLSEEQIKIIQEYVKGGGGLVASYETSLYDEKGRKRPDFGLKDVFGVSDTGIRKDTSVDSYQKIRKLHPVLEQMDVVNTKLIMNEGTTLLCRPLAGNEEQVICSYVPMIPNQPPEFAWITELSSEFPTIIENTYGKGRVVYFANQADKLCYTNGHEDFINTFINAVKWVKRAEFEMIVKAPPSVHITLMQKNMDSTQKVISFVNATGTGSRPFRMICPVHNIEASIILDEKEDYDAVIMKGGNEGTVETVEQDGRRMVRIRIDILHEFAAVEIHIK